MHSMLCCSLDVVVHEHVSLRIRLLPLSPAQEAGVPVKLARSIGIAVDHRRRNRSLESLQVPYWAQSVLLSRLGQPLQSLRRAAKTITQLACRSSESCPITHSCRVQHSLLKSTLPDHAWMQCTQENSGRLKGYKANLVLFPRNSKKPKSGEATAEERGAAVQLEGRTVMALPRSKPEVETVEITEEMQVPPVACLLNAWLLPERRFNARYQVARHLMGELTCAVVTSHFQPAYAHTVMTALANTKRSPAQPVLSCIKHSAHLRSICNLVQHGVWCAG